MITGSMLDHEAPDEQEGRAWEVGEGGRSLRRVDELPSLRAAALLVHLVTEIGEAPG